MTDISNLDYSDIPERYQTDCQEIVAACARKGLIITPKEAYTAWGNYSEALAAGWLGMPYPYDDYTQDQCDAEIRDTVKYWIDKG